MGPVKGHNTVTLVRLEPATARSRVHCAKSNITLMQKVWLALWDWNMYKQMNESMYGWKGKNYILLDILFINISGDIKYTDYKKS